MLTKLKNEGLIENMEIKSGSLWKKLINKSNLQKICNKHFD